MARTRPTTASARRTRELDLVRELGEVTGQAGPARLAPRGSRGVSEPAGEAEADAHGEVDRGDRADDA
jgi:hypothetical protein